MDMRSWEKLRCDDLPYKKVLRRRTMNAHSQPSCPSSDWNLTLLENRPMPKIFRMTKGKLEEVFKEMPINNS
jgi:hypothetical protein